MTLDLDDPVALAVRIAWALLLPGLALALFRIFRGPSTADRVVALDLVGYLVVGLAALRALERHQDHPLHPAMALALLSFLGTVVFARYLERKAVR